MTFQAVPADFLIPRTRKGNEIDIEQANGLMNLLIEAGKASDGMLYETEAKARTAVAKAKRLAEHSAVALPKGKKIRTRVGKPKTADGKAADGFSFEIALVDETPASK